MFVVGMRPVVVPSIVGMLPSDNGCWECQWGLFILFGSLFIMFVSLFIVLMPIIVRNANVSAVADQYKWQGMLPFPVVVWANNGSNCWNAIPVKR